VKKIQSPLLASAAACTVLFAGAAHAQFSTDGYIRAGTGAGLKNQTAQCYGLGGDGLKYRLGNECDTYVELNLKNTWKAGDVQLSGNLMPSYWKVGGSDAVTDLAQAFIEGNGFDFAPKATFWVGKRYYDRTDVHITDTKYVQLDGTGGGVYGLEGAGGKFGVSYFRRDNSAYVGWGAASRVNLEYSTSNLNPGGWFRVIGGFVKSEETYVDGSGNTVAGRNGISLTLQHYQDNVFGLGGGNTLFVQYAQGSSGLNGGFAKAFNNPGGDGNDWASDESGNNWIEDHKSLKHARIVDALTWQVGNFGGQAVAHVQQDDSVQYKTISTSIGGRLSYAFTNNFKLLVEAGVSSLKPGDASRQTLSKFTIAPTISTGKGFFERPELRLFYTRAQWNEAAENGGNGLPTGRSGNRYGLQAETWW
jgi:maltoporin